MKKSYCVKPGKCDIQGGFMKGKIVFGGELHVNSHTYKPAEMCDYDIKSTTNTRVTPIFKA